MVSSLLLLCLAAKPVAPIQRGPLDALDVSADSTGVLVRFEGLTRAQAQQLFDEVGKQPAFKNKLTVSFFKTSRGPLAAVYLGAPVIRFATLRQLAQTLSTRIGVVETFVFLYPAPRDETLETEAWERFSRGESVEAERRAFRDDPYYLSFVREQVTEAEWRTHRWPSYPLAELAQRVQLPGREVLEISRGMLALSASAAPTDAGENLAEVTIYLPGGMAMEMQQLAAKEKQSVSKLVAAALEEARVAKRLNVAAEVGTLAPYDEGRPGADQMAQRMLQLWLPEATLSPAEESANADASSFSRVVQKAWRRAHPHVKENP